MMKTDKKDIEILYLLTSVGLANIGEWIYFIALNMMILNQGGNAFSVGLLYIIRPIADILTNLISNAYIDRLSKKKWMISLSLLRALLVALLVFNQNLFFIYVIVFFIQVCISIYEPLSMSYITLAIPKNRIKKFNSWNSLVSSGGFLIGPGIAGFLLSIGTPLLAISINSMALLGSGLLLSFISDYHIVNSNTHKNSILEESRAAVQFLKKYYKSNHMTVVFYLLVSSLFIFAAGLDSVEAAFSKQVLLMSDGQYGLLVSISGAGFLTGSLLNSVFVEKLSIRQLILFGGFTYIMGYLIFSTSSTFEIASIGFFLISFALAYINTGFRTFIQLVFPLNKIGQLTTALNILNSLFEMLIVLIVSGLSMFIPLRVTLIFTEVVMVMIFILIVHFSRKLKINQLEGSWKGNGLLDEL